MEQRGNVSRREFLGRTAGAGVALGLGGSLWGARIARGQEAPNTRLAVGLIGAGGMGGSHLNALLGNRRVELVAIADVDAKRLKAAVDKTQGKATGYQDYREVLARDDIDAVWIATPDHWHGPITIQACRVGKDVYVEKPLSHNIHEGRLMVEAARQYGRVVQMGTQQRSQRHFQHVIEIVRSGQLGDIKHTHCWRQARKQTKWAADAEPPAELDYDMWLGPAPYVPYNEFRLHYNWRYFFDYGGGLMTDWGVHLIDIVLWGMGNPQPKTVEAQGAFEDDARGDVPITLETYYEFDGFDLKWTQDPKPEHDPGNHSYGIKFVGEKGWLYCDRDGYRIYDQDEQPLGPDDLRVPNTGSHHDNFIDCVYSREKPVCDIGVGQAITKVCLIGNLAFRIGRKLHWDGANEEFTGDPAASRLLWRSPRAPWGY